MCGIAGSISRASGAAAQQPIAAILRAVRHRGPDGEGILERPTPRGSVVLGHRRLAIIDRSAAASQPMSSPDGRHHIVLNGEIYNYLELRTELEAAGRRFRTRSDTEVLLEAWRAWGRAALDRVTGMFAFALLDERSRTVVLARDQFAMKPLYYVQTREGLAFASEIPPLLEWPGVSRDAHPGAVADFLARGTNNHVGRSMFADVQELPGAHLAEVSLDATPDVRPVRYWSAPSRQTHDLSFDAAAAELRARLEVSVGLHLRSDVPVGTMLSGGVDSSSILMLMRRVLGPGAELHAFSYRGEDGAVDEGPWMDAARSAARAVWHEVRLRPDEWAADALAVVAAQGEPFGSLAVYGQRRLFQLAATKGVGVILEGQGADELLAGYDGFRCGRLASLLRRGQLLEGARLARGFARAGQRRSALVRGALGMAWPALAAWRSRLMPEAHELLEPTWCARQGAVLSPPWRPKGPDILREMLGRWLCAPSLPWLMRYSDRNAMAFSVENRLPFLNARLVEFVLGLPEEHFIARDGQGKRLLRSAMRDLVPATILERRERVGFDVPMRAWLPRTPGIADLLDEAARLPAVRTGIAAALSRVVRSGQQVPRSEAFLAWRLVTFAAWVRHFGVRVS